MADLDHFVTRAEAAEREIDILVAELEILKTGGGEKDEAGEPPEELLKLREENKRLNYRLNILTRSYKKEASAAEGNSLPNIAASLVSNFSQAISSCFPSLARPPCPVVPSSKAGDYQFNGAMAIAGLLKAKGQKMSPKDIATKLAEKVPPNDMIEKLEIAGPGFINIFIRRSFIEKALNRTAQKGILPPASGPKKKVSSVVAE